MSIKIMRQGFLRDWLYSSFQRFYRHFPVMALDPASFRRLRRVNQLADRQWVRRSLAALILFVLAITLVSWMGIAYQHHVHHLDEDFLFSRIVLLTTAVSGSFVVCMALFWAKGVYRLAGTSMEDPGMTEFGIPYDKLTTAQRWPLMERYRDELWKRCFYPDERQRVEQERAERTAFRLLRRTAILLAVVVWAVYLIAPEGSIGRLLQLGNTLLNSPLVLSWIVLSLIALPTLIRLWTEPDEAGEPEVVEATPQKLIG
jgi:hypothetical protein